MRRADGIGSKTSTMTTIGHDGMHDETNVDSFVRRFTNNCVSDAELKVLATSKWASVLTKLPPKTIWLGEMLMMSDENFALVSFMYPSIEGFAMLITLGSLNY